MAATPDGLGRVFNVIPVADGVEVNLRDAGAVTFVCTLVDGDTFTVQESIGAAGTGRDLDVITRYSTSTAADGSVAWVDVERDTPDAAVTIGTGVDVAVFTVRAEQLSDDYTHVKCTSTSTGTVVAIAHDLHTQRKPSNLAPLGA
jgi:hypothetical protein